MTSTATIGTSSVLSSFIILELFWKSASNTKFGVTLIKEGKIPSKHKQMQLEYEVLFQSQQLKKQKALWQFIYTFKIQHCLKDSKVKLEI